MNTGILATAWMCLVLSQGPDDILYTNQRNLRIPVNFVEANRKDINEVLLYVSLDKGGNWQQAGRIAGDKDSFSFFASQDGPHWLRIASVNKAGKQDPDDRAIMAGPADMKMVIDTRQPIIRVIQAQRQGEEVLVTWDVQEDNPDLNGLRLEYQVNGAPDGNWTPIPATYALNGQTRFRPNNSQPLTVRLTVRDLAKNQSYGLSEIAGTVVAAGFANNNAPAPITPASIERTQQQGLPTLPAEMRLPAAPTSEVRVAPPMPAAPPTPPTPPAPPQMDPPPHQVLSPGFPGTLGSSPPVLPQPGVPSPPPTRREVAPAPEKVIADSRIPQKPVAPPEPPSSDIKTSVARDPNLPSRRVGTSPPTRKPLPDLLYVNKHQIALEYELRRVGPSGVGGIQVWITRDEGANWELFAEDPTIPSDATNSRQKRKFDFLDPDDHPYPDGIYGLILVVKSKAGLGRKPKPGDVPEVRVEIDTQPPLAVLYQPMPDPQHPDQVLLKWAAKDKNPATAPVNLEYAEKRDGPWMPVALNLENTGRYPSDEVTGDYSWKVPQGLPVQVYLRLRVSDKAGNESIAVTPEPQFLDLTEPEGTLIGVQPVLQK